MVIRIGERSSSFTMVSRRSNKLSTRRGENSSIGGSVLLANISDETRMNYDISNEVVIPTRVVVLMN